MPQKTEAFLKEVVTRYFPRYPLDEDIKLESSMGSWGNKFEDLDVLLKLATKGILYDTYTDWVFFLKAFRYDTVRLSDGHGNEAPLTIDPKKSLGLSKRRKIISDRKSVV